MTFEVPDTADVIVELGEDPNKRMLSFRKLLNNINVLNGGAAQVQADEGSLKILLASLADMLSTLALLHGGQSTTATLLGNSEATDVLNTKLGLLQSSDAVLASMQQNVRQDVLGNQTQLEVLLDVERTRLANTSRLLAQHEVRL